MSTESIHIIPRGKAWAARRSGSDRAMAVRKTQAEAVAFAACRGAVLYIHDKNGLIETRIPPEKQGA